MRKPKRKAESIAPCAACRGRGQEPFSEQATESSGTAWPKKVPDPALLLVARCVVGRRHGISLIEVLVSLFVMLFGLMGVAALFPVGNFYAQKGEKFDLGATLGLTALDELQTRGMLRPEKWLYANDPAFGLTAPYPFIQSSGSSAGQFTVPTNSTVHTGHAFVIDPRGASAFLPAPINLDIFPYHDADPNSAQTILQNYWNPNANNNLPNSFMSISGERWPIRRLTLDINPDPSTLTLMTSPLAEMIFTLRDDLVSEQPEEDDHPAIQRWEVNDQGTPAKNDDTLLSRQFQGNYTWLASIVPTSNAALPGLQPANPGYGQYDYDVSVVVFRKRDITPSAESERLVDARMLPGGEIEMFIEGNNIAANLDPAFKDIRSGDWIAVMGVHQTTGVFLMKWYRMLSMDRETSKNTLTGPTNGQYMRRAMLAGPDWPINSMNNLKVALLPGAISVVTKPMKMESESLWGSN
ncbi:MAG: hypothetical protein ABGX16_20830 [Pirellulales bacterium]